MSVWSLQGHRNGRGGPGLARGPQVLHICLNGRRKTFSKLFYFVECLGNMNVKVRTDDQIKCFHFIVKRMHQTRGLLFVEAIKKKFKHVQGKNKFNELESHKNVWNSKIFVLKNRRERSAVDSISLKFLVMSKYFLNIMITSCSAVLICCSFI